VNLIISQKSKKDLSDIPAQLELREEIRKSFNHILQGTIEEVYFREFELH